MKSICNLMLMLMVFGNLCCQEKDGRYNMQKLQQYIIKVESDRKDRIEKFLSENQGYNLPTGLMIRDISEEGNPLLYSSDNTSASRTIRANRLNSNGSLGLNLNGQGMVAGVWEVNGVSLLTHNDLMGRINVIDNSVNNTFHATHVTGTIISNGSSSTGGQGRGIAYEASVVVADADSDYSEMSSQANNGLLLSNHSYGYVASGLPLWVFGAYVDDSRIVDDICYLNEYYLPVFSAGNDRDSFTSLNPTKDGYDLINGDKTSKNGLTVGAVNSVAFYITPGSVSMSDFSNWGPTDDGRIKPDIVAQGVFVNSTSNASNTAYGLSSGTSMAAPGITGLLILLQQHYNDVNTSFMKSATAKGLLLHTALEAGVNPGPDYSFGWGLANGEAAAQLITDASLENGASINEITLENGDIYTQTVTTSGSEPLIVSISWTDPAGAIQTLTDGVDDSASRLVNDLDLSLERDGTIFYPWKLDGLNPSAAATRNSKNKSDNFEKVEVDTPNAGEVYTITVNHSGTLANPQDYTLIVSGGQVTNLSTTDFENNNKQLIIYPNPTTNFLNIVTKDNSDSIKGIVIYNAKGQKVLESKQANKYNVQSLPNGLYIVEVETDKGTYKEKFLKS